MTYLTLPSSVRGTLMLAALLSTSACFFTLDRGVDLNPGDVSGRALLEDGEVAGYARITIDGTGRTKRAANDGTFVLSNLQTGTWALRIDYDRDGDGWPEAVAHRTVTIVTKEDGERSSYILGDVVLVAPATLRGSVTLPDSLSLSGVDVTVTRRTPLSIDDAAFSADQPVEARVATGTDGRFFFPALALGAVIVRARVRTADDSFLISDELSFEVVPGDNQLSAPIVLNRIDEETAGEDDVLPPGTLVSADRREAVVFVTPKDDAGEAFVVDIVPTGSLPPPPNFDGPRVFSAGDTIIIGAVPYGTFDVYIRTDLDRSGVLFQRDVGPGEGPLSWGIIELGDLLCPNGDCDADGLPGLPPQAEAPDAWDACASQCMTGTTFDIAATATSSCTFAGAVFDCEDDGDGQPDTTEPACYGLHLGGDHDGDALCDPVDPYPFCAANNDTCDPDRVTGFYGEDSVTDVDAGPLPDGGSEPEPDAPIDAGPDGGVDAGPDVFVDGGPDAGSDGGVDAGPDGGVDGGLPATLFLDPINPITQTPERIFADDNGGFYLFGNVGEGGSLAEPPDCLNQDPTPQSFIWGFAAHFDAVGVCDRLTFSSASQFASARTRVVRDADGFAFVVFTSVPVQLGFSPSGDVVEDTTSAARFVTARFDANLNVTSTHRIMTLSDNQQPFGQAPFIVPMSPTQTFLVGNPGSTNVTYTAESGLTFTGTGSLIVLSLDGDLDMNAAFATGSQNGDALQLVDAIKHNDGLALALTGSGSAFGETLFATSTVLRLDETLQLTETVTTDLVDINQLASNANDLHAAGRSVDDPSGMYVFRPSFVSGSVINIALGEPGDAATGSGSIANVFNRDVAAFDPVTRSILTVSSSQILATQVPLTFGATSRVIATASLIRDLAIDATARELFFIDGSNILFRCNLDDCTAPTVVASFATSIEVDDVGSKIYFLGYGPQRANYDGSDLEFGIAFSSTDAIALDPIRRFFYVYSTSLIYRYDMDAVGTPTQLPGSIANLTQLEIDPITGRVYRVYSNFVESSDADGLDVRQNTVTGGNGATQALFSIVASNPSLDVGGTPVEVDFSQTMLMRLPNGGAPTVVPLAPALSGTPTVTVADMVHTDGQLTVATNVFGGDVSLPTGEVFNVLNERDGPNELFVARYFDNGTALLPQWTSTSFGSELMNMRAISVDTAGNTFSIVRSAHEGLLGSIPVSTRVQSFNAQSLIWRLPPEGDVAPSYAFLPPGGREATSVMGTNSDALFSKPFRDNGHVAVGETTTAGTYYVAREYPGATAWRHELPYAPIALDVSPQGEAIAVLFRFTGTFDFLGESQSATDGLAVLIFDSDGALLSTTYTELAGSSANAVAVNDNGRVVVGYTIATAITLDLQGTPIVLDEPGGFMVGSEDGLSHSTHGGVPGTSCDSVAIDDEGAMVGVMNYGSGNLIRLLHVTADFVFDWDATLSLIDGLFSAHQVRVSRSGGLVALGVLNDGDVPISVVSTCDAAGRSELPDDAHYAVFAFRANGCDSGFGRILASTAPSDAYEMDIVDRANNIVVVGPYAAGDTVTVGADVTSDAEITVNTPNAGLFVANFHPQSFRLRARGVFAADNVDNAQLRGFGALTNGDLWIHALTPPTTATFSDAPQTPVALSSGLVWLLDLTAAIDGFFVR